LNSKQTSALALATLIAYGAVAVATAQLGTSQAHKFLLAFFPLFVILSGVAFLHQSGLRMALIGLATTILLAVFQFSTSLEVALGASAIGFIKSLGISVSVAATMLMIYLMQETGTLKTVAKVIKHQVAGDETRALYVGIGFGSFLSSLGVVTPALFPPLLVAMGFSPTASIAIAVLGYDPTTSFSLLSIPITIPAQIGGLNPVEMAYKITLFLPLISIGFAFAILWLTGGKQAMRRGAAPATISGLTLALACLGTVSLDYFTGVEYIPLRIVGVVAGMCAMASVFAYERLKPQPAKPPKDEDYPTRKQVLRAFSPWIILTAFAATVSIQQVDSFLRTLPGNSEVITVFTNQKIDLDILSQIYTWIFVAILLSLATLKPTRTQARRAFTTWLKRFAGPFLAYSLYFCIAFVMAYSAMELVQGAVMPSPAYNTFNMNVVLGTTLATLFGAGYTFVAASLGLFGAIVGGSETSSNVLFLNIQRTATEKLGLDSTAFMTVYGSHAAAGGIASAVTPAKINNAVVTIGETHRTESLIMRKHLAVAVLLTAATGMLTGVLVSLGI